MKCKLYSHGGAQEVTGSKHFLETENGTLQIDCGAFQGRREEAYEKNKNWDFSASDVNAVILTHAHFDHCGMLPRLIHKGYDGFIYSTPATRDLAKLVLMDSSRIQMHDYEFMLKKERKYGKHLNPKEPFYTDKDVRNCMTHFSTVAYRRKFNPLPNIDATLYNAGHILGSEIVYLDVKKDCESMRIAFSGDLGRKNLPIIQDPDIIPPVDYLVLESTYGNRLHDKMDATLGQLAEIINRTVKHKGKIIIPSFAIERTQEIVYFIHELYDQKRITKIPVYIDSPMSADATTIFKMHDECYDDETNKLFIDHHENPFGFNDLIYVSSKEQSQKLNRRQGPMIIISSSGMCEHGRILHHLAHSIRDQRNVVLMIGYMAENTLGRKLLEGMNPIKIFGEEYHVRAGIEKLNSFSGHADYNEILQYVSEIDTSKLKKIFLVHGEKSAQENLKSLLKGKGFDTEIIVPGQKYELETQYYY